MRSYSRTFFSEKRAQAFAEQMKRNGAEDIEISAARDAFDQITYRVAWN